MPNTPVNSIPYPSSNDSPNGPLQMQNLALSIDRNLIPKFATTAARDAAIPSPENGMTVWCNSPGAYFDRIAGAWVPRPSFVLDTFTLANQPVPATARLVVVKHSVIVQPVSGGGFNAPYGVTFAGVIQVNMWPGDNANGLATVVPVIANHTTSQANGVALTATGAGVTAGQNTRINVEAIGYF